MSIQKHDLDQNIDVPRLYDKNEAANLLRVKVSWLTRRAGQRRIPFTLLGGEYRFTAEHLAEIIRLHEQGALSGESRHTSSRRRGRRRAPRAQTAPEGFEPLRARPRKAAS